MADEVERTANLYRRFGCIEAGFGRSPHYQELAGSVADDSAVLSFLCGLALAKRQPNLLFAAARYLLGQPADIASLRDLVSQRAPDLRDVMLSRRTQTNESARCTTLLPALGLVPGPVSLLEVGASAGLNLIVDRYSYVYTWAAGQPDGGGGAGQHLVRGADPNAPLLTCEVRGDVMPPLPAAVPNMAWRAGLDLNPLDVHNDDDVQWLECLLWPGEEGRAERLAAAIAAARRLPPIVHQGDLVEDLGRVAGGAPSGTSLVILSSAVLAYVDQAKRQEFAAAVHDLGATWLSSEGPGVVAGAGPEDDKPGFVLARNGAEVLARVCPHGTWLEWEMATPN